MTEEELKRNIDDGRKWLEAHGFRPHKPVDGYFKLVTWQNSAKDVEISEPDNDEARDIIENGSDEIWVCILYYWCRGLPPDSDAAACGATPQDALEKSIAMYDANMAELRRRKFGLALDEIDADNNFRDLKDAFDIAADKVRDRMLDFTSEVENLIDKFDDAKRSLSCTKDGDLNKLISWGFVPSAKVLYTRSDGTTEKLTFVGYCEVGRMMFINDKNDHKTYTSIEGTVANLDKFALRKEGK